MYRFVIVDDELFIMEMLLKIIDWESLGFVCAGSFTDGKEALDYLKENRVELLITDIKMPGATGLEIAKWLHSNAPKTQIILISAYQDFQHAVTAIEYNVKAYLVKPIAAGRLKNEIIKVKTELDKNNENLQNEIKAKNIIERVEDYVHKNYMNNITLEEAAAYVYLSPSYLSHLFSKSKNITFSDYIIMVRMEKAKKLLKNNNFKVYEVCDMVGYKNLNYFHQLFKKYTGLTPREYCKSDE